MKFISCLSKSFSIAITVILFATSCGMYGNVPSSNSLSPENFEPGKCYAKCAIMGEYKSTSKTVAIYTGDAEVENVTLQNIQIEVEPPSSKWVKKKADKNCLSADPNECLVWCLVDEPAKFKTIQILQDTSQSKNYRFQKVKGHTGLRLVDLEFKEVLCEQLITPEVLQELSFVLNNKGYLENDYSGVLDMALKNALSKFQAKHGLPQGQLDLETLEELGVGYE